MEINNCFENFNSSALLNYTFLLNNASRLSLQVSGHFICTKFLVYLVVFRLT